MIQSERSLLYVLAILGALGLAGCRCAKVTASGDFQPPPSLPSEFTLAVWNVRKSIDPASLPDLENLSKVKAADLILTQESPSDQPETSGLGSWFACGWRYPWPGGRYMGVRTYSRVKPDDGKAFPSRFREFWVTTPKVSLVTKIPFASTETLLAINIHGMNFERFHTLMLRSQLEELVPMIQSHEGPVVVAGDFNTWNARRLEVLLSFSEKLNLTEITSFPNGRKTGDMGGGLRNRLLGIDPALPLDRIFVRGLSARKASVLEYSSSDHQPLLVDLRPD